MVHKLGSKMQRTYKPLGIKQGIHASAKLGGKMLDVAQIASVLQPEFAVPIGIARGVTNAIEKASG